MQALRDYQNEGVGLIMKELETHQSTLGVMATGLGKTRVAVALTQLFLPAKTLFLSDREELVWQTRHAYLHQGIECEIEKAELAASVSLFSAPVVIATVQTLKSGKPDAKRMHRFRPTDFALVIFDEAHSSVSAGNKAIVDYFVGGNAGLKLVLLTATPDRSDGVSLRAVCQTAACNYDILFGIDNGWLVEPVPQIVTLGSLDISHVRASKKGDLNEADLAAVLEREEAVAGLIQPTFEAMFGLPQNSLIGLHPKDWRPVLEKAGKPLRSIVFTVSVKQAEMACNSFNRVWPGIAGWVCGETRKEARKELFESFEAGEMHILCNVGVTTQGYDNPNVGMIVMGRPTKSRLLAAQMIGRGTRPLKGLVDTVTKKESRLLKIALSSKPHCRVLDFACVTGKHKLVTVGDLLAGTKSPEAVARAMEAVKKAKEPMKVREIIAEEEEKLRKEAEDRRLAEEAKKVELVARVRYTTQSVDPFDLSDTPQASDGSWRRQEKLTPGERKTLIQGGMDPDQIPYHEGKRMARELWYRWRNKLVTPGQIKVLRPIYGGELDYNTLKRDQASAILDRLKANHWIKVPINTKQ